MTAVLLVSHGTVDELADLPAFITNVRRGHAPSPELVAELRRRYEAIGGRSPLNAINERLASALAGRLGVRVVTANRLWKPYVKDVLAALARDGVRRVAVVPLAQHSAHVYADDARRAAEGTGLQLVCAPDWGQNPRLCDAFAKRIRDVLGVADGTTVVMTAHSLPRAIVDRGDPYEREVRSAAKAIADRLGPGVRTVVAFQSQGMESGAGAWLGPDLRATFDEVLARGDRRVVLAPIGFLADHVETLYDLDLEAGAMARELGLQWARARSLDDSDDLVDVLADVAGELLRHG